MSLGKPLRRETILHCPRDRTLMTANRIGGATFYECDQCHGRFIEQGEMMAALGTHGDPSYWDRPECTRSLTDSSLVCPSCRSTMLLQTLQLPSLGPYRGDGEVVQIDRCKRCQGLWLDHGECERIVAIGQKMISNIEAERARAEDELDRMADPDFAPPTPFAAIARFFRG